MRRFPAVAVVLAAFGLAVLPSLAQAQGVLIVEDPVQVVRLPRPIIIYPPHPHPIPIPRPLPEPPATYKIQELEVNARIIDQVAQVQVSQSFVNTGSRQLEVSFVFPLPYDGAIDQLTLMVDGKEYPARLLKAEEARRMYEDIVRKNKDPALLEWMGTGLFKTSVFPVPPGAKRTVNLRYSQLCRMQEGLTDFLFPLSTAKYTSEAPEKVTLRASIESQVDIKNVYSPSHAIEVKRPDDRHAVVSYTLKNEVPGADFRLLYDVGKGKVSTRVLSYRPEKDSDKEGYFLLLTTPEIKADQERVKKTVLCVIDRSGSMSGKKIEQVKAALKFVLQNLREGDLFNIIAYDSEVEAFRPELQKYDDATRKAALGFVEGLYAGGSTNIDAALRTALNQLQDSSRPSYVLFLTDGLPTTGVTNEAKIVESAKGANKVRARIFAFGVGYDLNARLLDRLVRDAHGQSEYVRPNEDIEDRVSRLYRRIEAPVMTDVKIEFSLDEHKAEAGSAVSRVYPKGSFDLFAGEQLVVVGRYKTPGNAKVVVGGSVGGKPQKFDFPAKLVEKSGDETNAYIEKLWAVRRVGEILEEIDLKGKNDELVKELVELATRHGIITPYTSFLADENTNVRDVAANAARADRRLSALEATEGLSGVSQRQFRGSLQRAVAGESRSRAANEAFAPGMDAAYRSSGGAAGPAPLAAPGVPLAAGKPAAKREAGGRAGLGYGGGMMPGYSAARPGGSILGKAAEDADREMAEAEQTVRQIGNRTFYRRGAQWVDSTVAKDQEPKATRVKQFSKDYFELARRHGRSLSQYLVFDEPVLLNLEGRAYLIEP
jgi:Ca-activated chloride channel family protein